MTASAAATILWHGTGVTEGTLFKSTSAKNTAAASSSSSGSSNQASKYQTYKSAAFTLFMLSCLVVYSWVDLHDVFPILGLKQLKQNNTSDDHDDDQLAMPMLIVANDNNRPSTVPLKQKKKVKPKQQDTLKPDKQRQPLQLLFHVGPGKMGSSSIQQAISDYEPLLQQDKWVNYNHLQLAKLNSCLSSNNCNNGETEDFQAFLNQSLSNKSNVLLSTEMWYGNLDTLVLPAYKRMFAEAVAAATILQHYNYYDVKIIVAYRRFYEWLPSLYSQYYKFACPNLMQPVWSKKAREERGGLIPTLTDFLSLKGSQVHPTVATQKAFAQHFDNIELLSIHDGDILENIFCKVVRANQTCTMLQNRSTRAPSNKGKSLFFDRLAQQAIQQGIIYNNKDRCSEVSALLEQHNVYNQQSDATKINNGRRSSMDVSESFPLICPSNSILNAILETSLKTELSLFPELFNTTDIRKHFQIASNSTKLCDINVTAVLVDPAWRHFIMECDNTVL